jgi:hypothetical protein
VFTVLVIGKNLATFDANSLDDRVMCRAVGINAGLTGHGGEIDGSRKIKRLYLKERSGFSHRPGPIIAAGDKGPSGV